MKQFPPDSSDYPETLEDLTRVDSEFREWLRSRCDMRAGPRFSSWAWELVREDFAADLLTQLTITCTRPEFVLRGSARAYVDVCIANLCTRYFREVARIRNQDSIPVDDETLRARHSGALDRISATLDMAAALERLSTRCRSLILRKYSEQQSLAQIAAEDGISADLARSRLHACRQRFRKIWLELTG